MNCKLLWKRMLAGIMSVCLIGALTGCASSEVNGTEGTSANSQVEASAGETVESTEMQPVESEPVETAKELVEENVEEDGAESVETVPTEETQVEMVDFETWAKQEDHDEVCLVVWNEVLGVQEIMPTYQETEEVYVVQAGDKFAVPYRENIIYIESGDESLMWSGYEYMEISVPEGEVDQVIIIFDTEEGESENKNYFLDNRKTDSQED